MEPEYLSQAYWDDLKRRLAEVFGKEKADLLREFVWAVRFEHEKQHKVRKKDG